MKYHKLKQSFQPKALENVEAFLFFQSSSVHAYNDLKSQLKSLNQKVKCSQIKTKVFRFHLKNKIPLNLLHGPSFSCQIPEVKQISSILKIFENHKESIFLLGGFFHTKRDGQYVPQVFLNARQLELYQENEAIALRSLAFFGLPFFNQIYQILKHIQKV